jgi:hypothetical protein
MLYTVDMFNLRLVKETKEYEMSWQDFEKWYPKDAEVEGILKEHLGLEEEWKFDLLEPWRPLPPARSEKWQKGYVRFVFGRRH